MHCIDPRGSGDITASGKLWTYQGLDRTLSTVSVADGLLYICDVGGRLHCLDAATGKCHWVHDTKCEVWGSTPGGRRQGLHAHVQGPVGAGGRQGTEGPWPRTLGGKVYASPVVANGTMYVATNAGWLWAVRQRRQPPSRTKCGNFSGSTRATSRIFRH